eukprot:4451054-Karenia_brevis.AAC.1
MRDALSLKSEKGFKLPVGKIQIVVPNDESDLWLALEKKVVVTDGGDEDIEDDGDEDVEDGREEEP